MTFQNLIKRALKVRLQYEKLEKKKYGKSWSIDDLFQGLIGDVGDLSKLLQAKNGVRDIENLDEKLKHELSDCLWSLIIIANKLDIDIENSFLETMNKLEERFKEK